MAELRPIIVFHGRHFVRYLEICNPICVKLLQVMSVSFRAIYKKDVSISNHFPGVHKRGIHTHTHTHRQTHTHTHTHDDSIRGNAMHCISSKNGCGNTYYNGYRFPYRKKLNTGSVSRTGENKKGTGRYWKRIWFTVLEEMKYGYGLPYSSNCHFYNLLKTSDHTL